MSVAGILVAFASDWLISARQYWKEAKCEQFASLPNEGSMPLALPRSDVLKGEIKTKIKAWLWHNGSERHLVPINPFSLLVPLPVAQQA
jgi:hypothetical protein